MVGLTVNNPNEYNIQIETSNGAARAHTQNGHKYVPLKHETEYKIRLSNPTFTRCNVVLKIDQKKMGKWRINARSSILLERPADSSRKFTFVQENSWQADLGNVKQGGESNGLIEATFIPEEEIKNHHDMDSVSYTHLTLPTNREV